MSLLNNVKKEEAPTSTGASYQKRQREELVAHAKAVVAYAEGKSDFPQETLAWFKAKAEGRRASSKKEVKNSLNVIFGDQPKVGDKKTAIEVFESTGKGYSDMRALIKRWAKDGTVVEFDEASKVFEIKSINA